MIRKRPALFRGRHFEDAIILPCVRWYLRQAKAEHCRWLWPTAAMGFAWCIRFIRCLGRNSNTWPAGKACRKTASYFEHRNGRAASIPKRFTDLDAMDPVVVMGRGQCLFRVADLVELCSLIDSNALWEAEQT